MSPYALCSVLQCNFLLCIIRRRFCETRINVPFTYFTSSLEHIECSSRRRCSALEQIYGWESRNPCDVSAIENTAVMIEGFFSIQGNATSRKPIGVRTVRRTSKAAGPTEQLSSASACEAGSAQPASLSGTTGHQPAGIRTAESSRL